ncbi:MAG: endonuclease/exonuclease/phosphatase family protein, partial [Dehalococcoidia bacterium]
YYAVEESFITPFLVPIALRVLGHRNALLVTAGGLGLTRVVEQFVSSAAADLVLSMIGTVLFLWFLPILFHSPLGGGGRPGSSTAITLLVGIATDTTIKGAFGTVDPSWVEGVGSDMVMVILAAAQWLLLWRIARELPGEEPFQPVARALPLLALGPALVLELLLFQNVAQQTALIKWPQPAVYTWVLAANLAGIAGAILVTRWRRPVPWPAQAVLGGLLILMVVDEQSGILAAFVVLAGQIIIGLTFAFIATAGMGPNQRLGSAAVVAWTGIGMTLFLVLILAYYASYDIDLSIPRQALPPIGAALVAFSLLRSGPVIESRPLQWAPALPSLFLLILPLVSFLTWDDLTAEEGNGLPIRVMSYNLHQGFDVHGRLGMEALARVIEEQDPDIVALHEVSRGWVINDSVDTLVWLSQRLDMLYVWGPATDSAWGNAVLTRLPIRNAENHTMPNNDDILIDRGFISVEVDVGGGETLRILATHLHSGTDEGVHRIPQIEAMVAFWNGGDGTVLMGDLNAHPNDPEMLLLTESGLVDTFIASGTEGSGFTSESDNPWQRIDYIWMSSDLKARDFAVHQSLASDHLGIAVTIYR